MKKILVVDDETYTRELLEMLLKDENYDVLTAENGFEAIKQIQQYDIDLICLDIRMPVLNGFETLVEIRKINPEVGVIMITGYGPNDIIKRAEKEHLILKCIYKPFDIDDFLFTIREALLTK